MTHGRMTSLALAASVTTTSTAGMFLLMSIMATGVGCGEQAEPIARDMAPQTDSALPAVDIPPEPAAVVQVQVQDNEEEQPDTDQITDTTTDARPGSPPVYLDTDTLAFLKELARQNSVETPRPDNHNINQE